MGGIGIDRIIYMDVLRAVALLGMFAFHTVYNLTTFYNFPFVYDTGFWDIYRLTAIAGVFVFVSGWSATIGKNNNKKILWLSMSAFWVSFVTYFYLGDSWIKFGILHLLLVANFLYQIIFKKISTTGNIVLAIFCFVLSPWVVTINTNVYWFIWLDIIPDNYSAVDHYPLIPWLGVFILGVVWGRWGVLSYRYNVHNSTMLFRVIYWLSSRSLILYLLHQPILLLLMKIVLG